MCVTPTPTACDTLLPNTWGLQVRFEKDCFLCDQAQASSNNVVRSALGKARSQNEEGQALSWDVWQGSTMPSLNISPTLPQPPRFTHIQGRDLIKIPPTPSVNPKSASSLRVCLRYVAPCVHASDEKSSPFSLPKTKKMVLPSLDSFL